MGVQVGKGLPHSCGTKTGLKAFAQEDGSVDGYCFSCGTKVPNPFGEPRTVDSLPTPIVKKTPEQIQEELEEIAGYKTVDIKERKLRAGILSDFGAKVSLSESDGVTPTAIYWPVTKEGEVTGYHVKSINKGYVYNVGDTVDGDLLNWENAKRSGAYRLIITEGPEDMASVAAIWARYGDPEWTPAVVSLPRGAASASKSLTKHAKEIKRLFKDVVLCFDNDKAGQEAVEKAMLVLPEAKSVMLPEKDANECLVKGVQKAAFNALSYHASSPKNTRLISGDTLHFLAREPAKFGELTWPFEQMNADLRGARLGETVYIGAGVKCGKALSYSTVVPTPNGDRVWSTIEVGDYLFGTSGKPVKVTNRWDQGVKDIYNVTFSDGTSVFCCDEHLWEITSTKSGETKIVSTKDLPKTKRNIWYIPEYSAVSYQEQNLPIDPYVLGVWLGDGSSADGRVTNLDQEVWTNISARGYFIGDDCTPDRSTQFRTIYALAPLLKICNLLNNKHIPTQYVLSSFQQRLDLIRGLLDTDGWVEKRGQICFGNTNKSIYSGFVTICRSLGFIVRERKTRNGNFFVCCIRPPKDFEDVFLIKRKQERVKNCREGQYRRYITGVAFSHREEAMCVTVEADNSLFLANDFIVTHNSTLKNALFAHWMLNDGVPTFMACPEEDNKKSYKLLASQITGKVFTDPTVEFDEDAYDEAGRVLRSKLWALNMYQYLGWETLKGDIMEAVNTHGCKVIGIDPVTNLTNGVDPSSANTFLQGFAQEISAMAKDMNFLAVIFCHLNTPEGQISDETRQKAYKAGKYWDLGNCSHELGGSIYSTQFAGSRGMMRSANLLLAIKANKDVSLSRDIQDTRLITVLEDREWNNNTEYKVFYDRDTHQFTEIR